MSSEMALSHATFYNSARGVGAYRRATALQPPERTILDELRDELSGKRVLDIGVGAGRTVPHLTAISERYIGIDFAEAMVAHCRAAYPSREFRVCSAADLGCFEDASFDLAVFSFNGIDSLTHEERLCALAEIRRVLAGGGAFVFSSHNRNRPPVMCPWHPSRLPRPRAFIRPWAAAAGLRLYVTGIANYARNRRHDVHEEEYAIIVDEGHNDYSIRGYHIAADRQAAQLQAAGFGSVRIADLQGRWLSVEHAEACSDEWLYYLCRKETTTTAR